MFAGFSTPMAIGVLLLVVARMVSPGLLSAAEESPQDILRIRYQEFRQNGPVSGMPPLEVHSVEDEELLHAEVLGILKQPFGELAEALVDPAEWCRFIPLNFNIKACTYRRLDGSDRLTFYAGRKNYQGPEEAFRLQYRFEVPRREKDYLQVALGAEEGPMGTRDYRMLLEAMAVEEGAFVRFRSSYRPSLWSRMATSGYLATLGRGKVGFTILGYDEEGRPVYVQGVKGIVERNAVRYFLALKAYMLHRGLPPKERFERMLDTWYRFSESYPLQLHEQEREEYLRIKRRERQNQQSLQRQIDEGSAARFDPQEASGALSRAWDRSEARRGSAPRSMAANSPGGTGGLMR